MTKYNTNSWIFWSLLIVGLMLVAACSNGGPTVPEPSDVQDFSFEGGDGFDELEGNPLLTEFDALKALGGGAKQVADPEGKTLIGAFDPTTGHVLDLINIEVVQNDGTVSQHQLNGMGLFDGLAMPITVTLSSDTFISKTLIDTDADVICLAMEHTAEYDFPSVVVGYTFGSSYGSTAGWLIQAKSTHLGRDWQMTYGNATASPNVYAFANAYQPVGAVALLYEHQDPITQPITTGILDDYDLLGYSYSHIGTLDPGSVGAWILNFTEEGTGTEYTAGNYTFTHTGDPGEQQYRLVLSPGGILDDSQEFIPYYTEHNTGTDLDAGTYDLTAFSPPTPTDRDVIIAEAFYWDGAYEQRWFTFDPAGAAAPDLNFTSVPEVTSAVDSLLEESDTGHLMEAEWTNVATDGWLTLTFKDQYGLTRWEVMLDGASADLGAGLKWPHPIHQQAFSFTLTRTECTGFDFNNYDAASNFQNMVAEVTSADNHFTPGTISINNP